MGAFIINSPHRGHGQKLTVNLDFSVLKVFFFQFSNKIMSWCYYTMCSSRQWGIYFVHCIGWHGPLKIILIDKRIQSPDGKQIRSSALPQLHSGSIICLIHPISAWLDMTISKKRPCSNWKNSRDGPRGYLAQMLTERVHILWVIYKNVGPSLPLSAWDIQICVCTYTYLNL